MSREPYRGAVRRIVVAMSGGVDSSVAAAIMLEQGYEVVGVTLRLQDCEGAKATRSCCGMDGISRARAVAGQLGIPHYVLDCTGEFRDKVLYPAWEDYNSGRTPSPCLLCNRHLKFGLLLRWARALGFPLIATGHYARVERERGSEGLRLLRGTCPELDQSYFLAGLNQEQLACSVFPLGHMNKVEVRAKGSELGLVTAQASASQDACITGPGQSFAEALREKFSAPTRPGIVVDDEAGEVLGPHTGIHQFTIGQRKGLPSSSTRQWVKRLDATSSAVVVTRMEDNLYNRVFLIKGANWLMPVPMSAPTPATTAPPTPTPPSHTLSASSVTPTPSTPPSTSWPSPSPTASGAPSPDNFATNCAVQVRYRHKPVPATVTIDTHNTAPGPDPGTYRPTRGPDTAAVMLHEPVRAAAPGQAAVFYRGDRVLGMGWIDHVQD